MTRITTGQRYPASPAQQGFTLIEMLVTLVVAAVLLALAIPTFETTLRNNRLFTQVNDFHLALARARSEAMSRVQRVTICASTNGTSCNGTGAWEDGWIIFAEDHESQNGLPNTADGDEILEVRQELSGNNTLRGDTAVANYVSYVGTGFSTLVTGDPQTGKFALCDVRGSDKGKALLLNAAGRARVVDSAGNVTSCTSP